ncbi:MAG: fatty-acid synthase [Acidobacteria bacterium]|nr:fatty-acid synthase [Acidobacteriota bacterium]
MPKRDAYHEIVKRALDKDGWTITDDPMRLKYKGLHLYVDLAAVKTVRTDKEENSVAIEVKVFGGHSFSNDFEKAIGQYSLYRDVLERLDYPHELFLAVSRRVYDEDFQVPAILEYLASHRIYLLIFDPEKEEVSEWRR